MANEQPATPKAVIDWEKVEREFRAGVLSLREIGDANGCSHVAVSKRAKAEAWPRDLKARIKAKADELVNKAVVTTEVTSTRLVRDLETVEANARVIADIRLAHRNDITRARRLTNKLLDELEGLTDNRELFEQLGDFLRKEGEDGQDKRNDLYMKIIELPSRTKTMKDLAETLKTLVGLERQAYDLDTKLGDPATPFVIDNRVDWAGMPLDVLKAVEAAIASEPKQD
jgi:hypothetical protein